MDCFRHLHEIVSGVRIESCLDSSFVSLLSAPRWRNGRFMKDAPLRHVGRGVLSFFLGIAFFILTRNTFPCLPLHRMPSPSNPNRHHAVDALHYDIFLSTQQYFRPRIRTNRQLTIRPLPSTTGICTLLQTSLLDQRLHRRPTQRLAHHQRQRTLPPHQIRSP